MLSHYYTISDLGLSTTITKILLFNGLGTIQQLIAYAQDARELKKLTSHDRTEMLNLRDLVEIDSKLTACGFQDSIPKRTYLHKLALSQRTQNVLIRNDVLTIEQLKTINPTQIGQWQGIGAKGVEEIYAKLASFSTQTVDPSIFDDTDTSNNQSSNSIQGSILSSVHDEDLVNGWKELQKAIRSQIEKGSLHRKVRIQGDTLDYWMNLNPASTDTGYLKRVHGSLVIGIGYGSINQELEDIFSGLSSKEISIFLNRFGPTRETLETLGQQWGITRERVRQIAGKAGRKVESRIAHRFCLRIQTALLVAQEMGDRIVYGKWLSHLRKSGLASSWKTREVAQIFENLDLPIVLYAICNSTEQRIYQCLYPLPENLLCVFGKKSISAYVINKIENIAKPQIRRVFRNARIGGAVSIQTVSRQLSLSVGDAEQILKGLGFRQVGQDWYTLAPKSNGDTAHRKWVALHTTMKMLRYCGNLEIKEIHLGLRRYASRFKFEVPPPGVLACILKLYGFDFVDEKVTWKLPNTVDTGKGEQLVLERLRDLGGVAGYFEFAEEFEKQGKSFPLLSVTLSKSPLICKVESGLYKLRGSNPSYEDILRARTRQSTISAESDVTFSLDGSIALQLNLGSMAIYTGVISSPHLASLDGTWNIEPATSNGNKVRVQDNQMWTLTKAFREAGARLGDRIEIIFNTWSRTVSVRNTQ